MERADVRAGLGLDRRGGLVRVELQQEAPVALPPLEQRLRVTALGGVEEVVVARRDVGKEVAVLARDDLLGLGQVVAVGEIADRFARRDVHADGPPAPRRGAREGRCASGREMPAGPPTSRR